MKFRLCVEKRRASFSPDEFGRRLSATFSKGMSVPKLSPEEIRARVLADPHTSAIARQIGLALEEYVALVVQYATNPELEAELYVVKDDVLARETGYQAPTEQQLHDFVRQGAATQRASGESTRFEAAAKPKVALTVVPERPAEIRKDSVLSAELAAQLRRVRGGKT
jgi:hypothetical protein